MVDRTHQIARTRRTQRIVLVAVVASVLVLALLYALTDSRLLRAMFKIEFVTQVIGIAIPLTLAALCAAITERSGVIDLAIEAKWLFGAFAAASLSNATGSPVIGVLAGMAVGVGVAALQLGLALRLSANQVIVGIGLNLLALGGTRLLLQMIFGQGAGIQCEGFDDAVLENLVFWIALIAVFAVPFALVRTRWGLRLRAAGDRPESLVAVGVSPTTTRFAAGLVGGALAGAGGAHLSLAGSGFVPDMTAGRGYIALAMVILAGWRPAWAVLACLGMAVAEAFTTELGGAGSAIPRELMPLLPYVLTLLVLVIAGGRPGPRSLGRL
jgi:simple sugar transport system permease protein